MTIKRYRFLLYKKPDDLEPKEIIEEKVGATYPVEYLWKSIGRQVAVLGYRRVDLEEEVVG